MEHKMSKDLPLTFEEQLRRDCPALFQFNENPLVAMRRTTDPEGDRHPDYEVGNEPGDELGNQFLNPKPTPAPQRQNPALSRRVQQAGTQGRQVGLGAKMMEIEAARNMRKKIFDDMSDLSLEELHEIGKVVRYMKASLQGRKHRAANVRGELDA